MQQMIYTINILYIVLIANPSIDALVMSVNTLTSSITAPRCLTLTLSSTATWLWAHFGSASLAYRR